MMCFNREIGNINILWFSSIFSLPVPLLRMRVRNLSIQIHCVWSHSGRIRKHTPLLEVFGCGFGDWVWVKWQQVTSSLDACHLFCHKYSTFIHPGVPFWNNLKESHIMVAPHLLESSKFLKLWNEKV